jgi:hypothetical protein
VIQDDSEVNHTLELFADVIKFIDRLEYEADKSEKNLLAKFPEFTSGKKLAHRRSLWQF